MPIPTKNSPIDKTIGKDILPILIDCDISVIFKVPVFTYNIPIASKINTAPILPINKYCIAAIGEALCVPCEIKK